MKNLLKAPIDWYKSGSPWIWLNGGAVTLCMLMVVGLLTLIAVRGFGHFWPADILQTTVTDNTGKVQTILAEEVRSEIIPAVIARDNGYTVPDNQELLTRHLMKLGNRDVTSCGSSSWGWASGNTPKMQS
jgi:phosphate transport system permease protein